MAPESAAATPEPRPVTRAWPRLLAFWPAAVLALVIGAGVVLRAHHLDTFPAHNQTADEFAWTWAGMSLLETGTPRSWSWLDRPGNPPVITWRGNAYRLVEPWVEHPPLYPLLMGVWMRALGTRDMFAVDLRQMRWSSVLLFIAAALLLYRLVTRVSGRPHALLTVFLYSTSMPVVLQGRLVVCEQLLVPLVLGALLCIHRLAEVRSRPALWGLVLLSAALPLTKLPAAALCLCLLVVATAQRRWPAVLAVVGGTLAGVVGYLLYGWLLAGDLFVTLMQAQRGRFGGFDGFFQLVLAPKLVNVDMVYLPFVLAFALGCKALLDDTLTTLATPVLVYPAVMTALVIQGAVYGWYEIPLYPFYAAMLGGYFLALMRGQTTHGWWLWFVVLLPHLGHRWVEMRWFTLDQARLVYFGLILLTALWTRVPALTARRGALVMGSILLAASTAVDVAVAWRQ